ncbi:MAG TPA: hypothetical protein VK623_04075 [Flavobacterium sp.]|nr:hypothetical protein [Flavobacterium sp.]
MKTKILLLLLAFQLNGFAQDTLQRVIPIPKRKISVPIGLFTKPNRDIYGLSVGVGSYTSADYSATFTRSNGIRIEPVSSALLIFTLIAGPDDIDFPSKPEDYAAYAKLHPAEIINGINISCGTNSFVNVNGITISAVAQSVKNTNGISICGLGGGSFRNNGIQLAFGGTDAVYSRGIIASAVNTTVYDGKGLMVGGFNNYTKFSGLQIGMWNDINQESEKFTGLQIGFFNHTKKLKGVQIGLWNVNNRRTLPIMNWNFKS